MAKGRSKKLRDTWQPGSNPNASKKIKKKVSNRKKKTSKINAASIPTTGLSSISISSPVTASGAIVAPVTATDAIVAPVSILTTTSERKVVIKERKEEVGNSESSISGFIFMCNNKTKPECYQYRVFGLPIGKLEVVKKIKMGMKLFLFDFDLKLLYGVYEATSDGDLRLETAAFRGRFPAQVRFKICKDCLPLPESALKLGIGDIYQGGSKFRQELSGRQVKTLISLFRPITVPLQASVAPPLPNLAQQHLFVAPVMEERFQPPTMLPPAAAPLPNVGPPRSYAAPVMEERFQPPTRLLPPEEPYISGVHHIDAPPAFDPRSVQGAPPPMYDYYGSARHVAHSQPPVESHHVVPPCHVDPYYLEGMHEPYFPENPVLSTQDPHKRYVVAPDMIPRDQLVGHGSEYHMSQLLRERGTIPYPERVVDYYNQHLPPIASSYATLQARALPESHAPLPSSNPPVGLSSSYQAYYTVPIVEDTSRVYVDSHQTPMSGGTNFAGANVPVSSLYSFAGAAPTYQ